MARVAVAALAVVFALGLFRLSGFGAEFAALAAAVIILPVVAVVTGQPRRLLLGVVLLELPFGLDVHLFYNEEVAYHGAIVGLGVSVTTAALAALYALWLGEILIRRSRERQSWIVRTPLALVGYVAVVTASILVAKNPAMAMYEVVLLVQILLLYLYLLHVMQGWRDVHFVLSMLLLGLIIESAIMLTLPLVGESVRVGFVNATILRETGRVGGTFGHPNVAGAYLSMMMALATGVLLSSQRGWLRAAALAGLMLGGVAIILTGSRGGWLALIISAAVLSVTAWRRGWLPAAVPAAAGLGVVCLAVVFQTVLAPRFFPENQDAATDRVPLMFLAGRMIVDKPLLGVGANNFVIRAEDYWANRTEEEWLSTVHNKYLLVASENGLLGFTMFGLFLFLTVRYGFQASRSQDRLLGPVALGLTAGVIGQMVHLLVDIFNARQQVELLWVVAALIAVLYRMNIQRKPEVDDRYADTASEFGFSIVGSGDRAVTSSMQPVQWSDQDR